MQLVLRVAGGLSGAHHTKTCEASHKVSELVHLAITGQMTLQSEVTCSQAAPFIIATGMLRAQVGRLADAFPFLWAYSCQADTSVSTSQSRINATGSSVLPLSVVLMFRKPAGLTSDNRRIY